MSPKCDNNKLKATRNISSCQPQLYSGNLLKVIWVKHNILHPCLIVESSMVKHHLLNNDSPTVKCKHFTFHPSLIMESSMESYNVKHDHFTFHPCLIMESSQIKYNHFIFSHQLFFFFLLLIISIRLFLVHIAYLNSCYHVWWDGTWHTW